MPAPPYIAKARRRRRNRAVTWVFVVVAPWAVVALLIGAASAIEGWLR